MKAQSNETCLDAHMGPDMNARSYGVNISSIYKDNSRSNHVSMYESKKKEKRRQNIHFRLFNRVFRVNLYLQVPIDLTWSHCQALIVTLHQSHPHPALSPHTVRPSGKPSPVEVQLTKDPSQGLGI